MDSLQEPIKCPHGGECFVLADGSEYWAVPCPQRTCEAKAVAPAQRSARSRQRLSA